MYNVKSMNANEFIDDGEIMESIDEAIKVSKNKSEIEKVLTKARQFRGLTHREAAVLLQVEDDEILNEMFKIAREVKEAI